jgi:hypothetical protein
MAGDSLLAGFEALAALAAAQEASAPCGLSREGLDRCTKQDPARMGESLRMKRLANHGAHLQVPDGAANSLLSIKKMQKTYR